MSTRDEILEKSNRIYDRAVLESSTSSERVLWNDPQKQYLRFNEIAHFMPDLQRSDIKILDFGCGNGEFLKYLNALGFRGTYTGIDINMNLLEEARRRYPLGNFRHLDILSKEIEMHDIAVISGVFNIDVGQGLEFVRDILLRLSRFTSHRLIFNAITTYVSRRDSGFFYLSPSDSIEIASSIGGRFEMRHGILPFNYTMVIHTDIVEWKSLT